MHPFEHLRHVARGRSADPVGVAREAAFALSSLGNDPFNLVLACRRLLQRQPGSAPLWWLCSQLVTCQHPGEQAWDLIEQLDSDAAADALVDALPDAATVAAIGWSPVMAVVAAERDDIDLVRPSAIGDAVDVTVIEAVAAGERRLLAEPGSAQLARSAVDCGSEVWCVVEPGRRLPHEYLDRIAEAGGLDEVDLALLSILVDASGARPFDATELRADCPYAPELLRRSAI
jgi:hypothetical protein